MRIDDIIQTREQLNKELRMALSTMERKDTIQKIKLAIIDNQKHCPHASAKYNWEITNDTCPYCGFHFSTGGIWRENENDKGY